MIEVAGPLLLVGCGKMGGALLTGWLAHGLAADRVVVVEPAGSVRERLQHAHPWLVAVADAAGLPDSLRPQAIIVAIKPQMMADALPAYAAFAAGGAVVLSIAAGTSIERFRGAFGDAAAIVRAMPNTPAAIGRGVSVLYANEATSGPQRQACQALMAAVGAVHWVEDEERLHAVTAMSGGGPAYVFLLIESLARAAMRHGLAEELSMPLARQTVIGSAALAADDQRPVEQLRADVTSPGGTTQAALEVLMAADGMQPLFERALAAGIERSRALA